MESTQPITTDDLRAWQARMGYTYQTAAQALGMARSGYAKLLAGVDQQGDPRELDKRTGLACWALELQAKTRSE